MMHPSRCCGWRTSPPDRPGDAHQPWKATTGVLALNAKHRAFLSPVARRRQTLLLQRGSRTIWEAQALDSTWRYRRPRRLLAIVAAGALIVVAAQAAAAYSSATQTEHTSKAAPEAKELSGLVSSPTYPNCTGACPTSGRPPTPPCVLGTGWDAPEGMSAGSTGPDLGHPPGPGDACRGGGRWGPDRAVTILLDQRPRWRAGRAGSGQHSVR